MSDLLLQIVAIRLGALVLAGLMIQALPEQRSAPSCVPVASVQRDASAPDLATRADAVWRDMRLYD